MAGRGKIGENHEADQGDKSSQEEHQDLQITHDDIF